MSVLAVGLDFGCEATFPVPENSSTGVQLACSQIICTAQIVVASIVFSKSETLEKKVWSMEKAILMGVILVASLAVGFVCSVFTKEDLRKTIYDKGREADDRLQLNK